MLFFLKVLLFFSTIFLSIPSFYSLLSCSLSPPLPSILLFILCFLYYIIHTYIHICIYLSMKSQNSKSSDMLYLKCLNRLQIIYTLSLKFIIFCLRKIKLNRFLQLIVSKLHTFLGFLLDFHIHFRLTQTDRTVWPLFLAFMAEIVPTDKQTS